MLYELCLNFIKTFWIFLAFSPVLPKFYSWFQKNLFLNKLQRQDRVQKIHFFFSHSLFLPWLLSLNFKIWLPLISGHFKYILLQGRNWEQRGVRRWRGWGGHRTLPDWNQSESKIWTWKDSKNLWSQY